MHISEGVLSGPVLLTGAACAFAGLAAGLRRLQPAEIPRVALLTAAFFVASLVHVPIGPASSHLILNGLLGILLGWTAFPAIFIALTLQAVLFQFGGLTTLGINTVNMALPAVIVGLLARPALRRGTGALAAATAALAGVGAIVLSGIMTAASLAFSGEGFLVAGRLILLAHVPVAIIEGVISAITVSFLLKTRPELVKGMWANNAPARTVFMVAASLFLSVLLAAPDHACAHRVNVFAWYDGSRIQAEGYFPDGRKAAGVPVEIVDPSGKRVFLGETDDEGAVSYETTVNGDYRLVLQAGMGHRAETVVSVEAPESERSALEPEQSPDREVPPEVATPPAGVSSTGTRGTEELNRVLDRKLDPIREQLKRIAEREQGVKPRDVVAGLGYIAGIMGLAMYMSCRKKTRPKDKGDNTDR
jgi:cobalt/nickel transport system permease protein